MNERPETPADDPAEPTPAARAELAPAGCTPSLEELYRYMDGALDGSRKAHVESHLHACGGCGQLYDVQAQFLRLIGVRCKEPLPPDLPDRIFGAIAELGQPPKPSP